MTGGQGGKTQGKNTKHFKHLKKERKRKKEMTEEGFEPSPSEGLEPESSVLDHSTILPSSLPEDHPGAISRLL